MGKKPVKRQHPSLTEREREVFKAVMNQYISEAEPVGSRKIARQFKLSPATIRNIMADLEEHGLLEQPHVSAGRIPSDKGYRFYVDEIIGSTGKQPVSEEHRSHIRESLKPEFEFEQVLKQVSDILSRLTHYAGMVVLPRIVNTVYRRIQFVRLGDRRLLAIFVTNSGLVNSKVIMVDQDYGQDMLEHISNLFNERFENMTLEDIRLELCEMMEEERRAYDALLDAAARLGEMALSQELLRNEKVYIEGTMNIFDLPDFKNLGKIKELFKALTERTAMIRLLNRCLDSEGVTVAIGKEAELPDIDDISVVTSPYSISGDRAGTLGVIGPKRMPYGHVVSLVAYMSRVLSLILEDLDRKDTLNWSNVGLEEER